MEQRIKLTSRTIFDLDPSELHRFYTVMSLLQYKYRRVPEYKEQALLRRLHNDFQRFNTEITKLRDADPNNLVLSQIQNFIQLHYGLLKSDK